MTVTTAIDEAAGERAGGEYAPIIGGPSFLRRPLNRILRRLEIRRQERSLQEMPDDLLRDVGIERCAIGRIAEEMVDSRADSRRWPLEIA